uniref:Laminin, alpha 4 n=1 Tax=Gadus morhua TaxID=8049 RepID=A0A8C5FCU6_GADMO
CVLQACGSGFFLSEQLTCLPCNCKGHADYCQDVTGICSVSINITGDFCEMCEDGYMLAPSLHGNHVCRPCACPLHNKMAAIIPPSTPPPPRCSPGYYGNPMVVGDSCKRCDCNGNSDPNLIVNECHNVTGRCLTCWDNTAGDNCERCAPGYHGDAISAKDCRGCDECIWHLIGDMKASNQTLDQMMVSVLNISTGAAANDRLKYYNYTAHRLQVLLLYYNYTTHRVQVLLLYYNYTAHRLHIVLQLHCSQATGTTTILQLHCSQATGTTTILQLHCSQVHTNVMVYVLFHKVHTNVMVYVLFHKVYTNAMVYVLFNKVYTNVMVYVLFHKVYTNVMVYDLFNKVYTNVMVYVLFHKVYPNVMVYVLFHKVHTNVMVYVLFHKVHTNVMVYVLFHKVYTNVMVYVLFHKVYTNVMVYVLFHKVYTNVMVYVLFHKVYTNVMVYVLSRDLKRSDANGFVQRAVSAANVYNNIVKYIDDANDTAVTTQSLSERAGDVRHQHTLRGSTHGSDYTEIHPHVNQYTIQDQIIQRFILMLINIRYRIRLYRHSSSLESLHLLVPALLEKLKVVEQKKPVNNVTTNILRIRELIAQARSVAKKVQVSMKFDGQSSVEVQPHSNLEELKTSTSISLFIRVDPDKDPIEDRFVLYLGDRNGKKDYVGLAIKNDNLVYVYNLGGEDVEIPLSTKPVSQWPPVFNYVKVERLGRHGKVFLTIPSQTTSDEQKFIQKGVSLGTDSLFDIDPKDIVFFVGGVPPDVTLPPPLSLAPFVGCIELGSLNNDVISLYNFKETHMVDVIATPPCPRYKLAFSQSRISSYLFDGTGFALINNMERRGKFGVVTRFDIAVRTVANDGLLLLMANFFILELKNGYLRLEYDFGFDNGPHRIENHIPLLKINDARYHEVSVIYHQSKKVILLVDKSYVKSVENPHKITLPFSDIYIGGAPSQVLSARPELSEVVGLRGCVKNFQFQKKDFNLLEEPGTIGISNGCPEEAFMSRRAYFAGQGYLGSTAKISPFDSFEGGLNFRTLNPSGLLFYHNEGSHIALDNGMVVLNAKGTKVKSHKKHYNDGRTHFLVSLSRQDRDIEAEDFQRYAEKVNASLQDCPIERPPAALLTPGSARKPKPSQSKKVARDGSSQRDEDLGEASCHLPSRPRAVRQAFRYGGSAHSRQEYHLPQPLANRSHFSLSLRTEAPAGLLFYVADQAGEDFMALVLDQGQLVFSFRSTAHRVQIRSQGAYNDGGWHSVICIRDGNAGQLIIDDLTGQEERAPGVDQSWRVQSPLYVGGAPLGHAQKNIQSLRSLSGCVRRLMLDGRQLSSASATFGATPCYDGPQEPGTFFSQEGGYIALDETAVLGRRLELSLEVRPRVATGVLVHIQAAEEEYMTVYLHQGAVVVLVNVGVRQFLTVVAPRDGLCTGAWHRITVIRDANVVQLDVDSEVDHTVGPLNLVAMEMESPVFIGGAPEGLVPEGVATRRPYAGCMRSLSINSSPVSFSKAALVSGAVAIGSCPTA